MGGKRVKKRKIGQTSLSSYHWLPIDHRLIPDIFAFSSVKGLARIFLTIEIAISVFVVSVSLTMFILRVFGLA